MAFLTVTGRLLASHFQAGGEVPLSGQIFFTPTMEKVPTGEGVHLPAATSVELDGDGRFEVELLSAGFSWEVGFSLRHAGAFVPVGCFNFLPETGVDRVNFADIVPVIDPVTSQPMLRGEDGVGVEAITTEAGELIFTLTDGTESRIPVPQGIPGTGVDTITLQGDELVFTLSDGSETRIPAPAGAPGADAPKPTLAVGEVQTLPAGANATAEVTGESPDFTLSLGLPAGADGKTPTITAGTVSTLPAGAPATAAMVPTTGGYALNLGLPAGAPGANGKDAPTPTLAVGTVSTGTASASITGTAPNFVLNLTLPAGSKGEPGNPSTMTLVGAGRPDAPATLSTANQTAVANAAVGATFTSTDGAGTGAWAWVKTPTGWAVTYADTGWRNVTASFREANPTCTGGRLRIRRENNQLWVSTDNLTFSSTASVSLLGHLPTEWHIDADPSTYPGAFYQLGGTGSSARVDKADLVLSPSGGMVRDIKAFPITTKSWPSTRPGTPA